MRAVSAVRIVFRARSGRAGRQQLLHVFAQQVELQIDQVAGTVVPQVRHLERVRNQPDGKVSPSTSATVSEMPSMAMLPLCTSYRPEPAGAAPADSILPPGLKDLDPPGPSMWPVTKWPPTLPSNRRLRSRLTAEPGRSAEKLVSRRVSSRTSK